MAGGLDKHRRQRAGGRGPRLTQPRERDGEEGARAHTQSRGGSRAGAAMASGLDKHRRRRVGGRGPRLTLRIVAATCGKLASQHGPLKVRPRERSRGGQSRPGYAAAGGLTGDREERREDLGRCAAGKGALPSKNGDVSSREQSAIAHRSRKEEMVRLGEDELRSVLERGDVLDGGHGEEQGYADLFPQPALPEDSRRGRWSSPELKLISALPFAWGETHRETERARESVGECGRRGPRSGVSGQPPAGDQPLVGSVLHHAPRRSAFKQRVARRRWSPPASARVERPRFTGSCAVVREPQRLLWLCSLPPPTRPPGWSSRAPMPPELVRAAAGPRGRR